MPDLLWFWCRKTVLGTTVGRWGALGGHVEGRRRRRDPPPNRLASKDTCPASFLRPPPLTPTGDVCSHHHSTAQHSQLDLLTVLKETYTRGRVELTCGCVVVVGLAGPLAPRPSKASCVSSRHRAHCTTTHTSGPLYLDTIFALCVGTYCGCGVCVPLGPCLLA